MAGDDRGRPIDALLDGGDRKRGSNLLAVSGSESGSHMTLRWRDSNPRSPVAADSISGAKSDFREENRRRRVSQAESGCRLLSELRTGPAISEPSAPRSLFRDQPRRWGARHGADNLRWQRS